MSLTLTIVSYQSATPEVRATKVFGPGGGSIGRSPANAWQLPDPKMFISSHHARIGWEDGQYFITDISLNGSSLNGEPIGKNKTRPLQDGDRMDIGDYEITVAIDAADESPPGTAPEASQPQTQGAAPAPSGEVALPEPSFGLGIAESESGFDPFATPNEELEATREIALPVQQDVAPVHEAFQAPQAAPEIAEIPEDWWNDTQPRPASEPQREIKPAPTGTEPLSAEAPPTPSEATPPEQPPAGAVEPVSAPASPVEQQPARQAKPNVGAAPEMSAAPPVSSTAEVSAATEVGDASAATALAAFLRGAGLTEADFRQADEAALMELVGEVFRELVQGIMKVLMARASIKSEARVPVTVVQPLANNPLKFSFTVEDALKKLLESESNRTAYMEPKQAVQEAIEDIQAHQVATLAGLEAALKELFHRFDPERLEEQLLERSMADNLMPSHRKARCWDAYTAHFRRMAEEAQEDFQRLFGREFARAYEEQVRRLKSG